MDIAGSLALMVALSPLSAAVALFVRVSLGRPILYRQLRAGQGGRPFALYKFRTMAEGHDGRGRHLPDADRLTRAGRLLRGLSLDELPELWNVLRGDMSLVGPRPLLLDYLPRYSAVQARRHEVRPGVTGWAQVHGRNAVTWEDRFQHDVWYVDHMSLALDLRILALTLVAVLRRQGISQPGAATMEPFLGNRT